MKYGAALILFFAFTAAFVPFRAFGACASPPGQSGEQTWFASDSTVKYCDGALWKTMGDIAPAAGNLDIEIITKTLAATDANGWYQADCPSGKVTTGGSCSSTSLLFNINTDVTTNAYRCYKNSILSAWTIKAICVTP